MNSWARGTYYVPLQCNMVCLFALFFLKNKEVWSTDSYCTIDALDLDSIVKDRSQSVTTLIVPSR